MEKNLNIDSIQLTMGTPVQKDQILEERRLWIGNLDPRITEYQLLKLAQRHGAIEKFDLLFHRSGPLAGQPRGYAFVTYRKRNEAEKAREALDGSMVGTKKIAVKWAHAVSHEDYEKPKPEVKIPALAMAKEEKKTDRVSQIQAIEEKLKLMEKKKDDELRINDTVATKPAVISQYQFNKDKNNLKQKQPLKKSERFKKPYNKNRSHR